MQKSNLPLIFVAVQTFGIGPKGIRQATAIKRPACPSKSSVRVMFIHSVRGAGVRSSLVTGGVPSWGCTLIRWQAFGVVPRCGSYEEGCRSTPTHEQVFFFGECEFSCLG